MPTVSPPALAPTAWITKSSAVFVARRAGPCPRMRWVKIEDVGDTGFLIDEPVDRFRFMEETPTPEELELERVLRGA